MILILFLYLICWLLGWCTIIILSVVVSGSGGGGGGGGGGV
jgi:hypothetical protein